MILAKYQMTKRSPMKLNRTNNKKVTKQLTKNNTSDECLLINAKKIKVHQIILLLLLLLLLSGQI